MIRQRWHQWLEKERLLLSRQDALLPLALLGVVTGLLSGGIIVLFRLLVEETLMLILPDTPLGREHDAENYEGLPQIFHFLLPVISGCLLALLFYKYSNGLRVLGIARVLERVAYHQGYLTLRGLFLQFVGAAIAIIGGHSVGREGPHVYLGAAVGSLFGQFFKLPNNAIRIMLACGVAAGIAASFNTPLAGVIFALEIVVMEYTLSSFIPIILSAGVATALSNAILGSMPAFVVPTVTMASLSEIPIVLLLGLVAGASSALLTHSIERIAILTRSIELWWKLIMAGFIVGIIGWFQPEVLGIGYDTVTYMLLGQFGAGLLLGLIAMKMLATAFCVGLGVPGGVIGPGFFIGAAIGSAFGLIIGEYTGATETFIGFYALLGMGAVVAAMLQAPLTALTAIVELTYNPGIVMPGMLCIVVAQLTASQIFKKQSLFIALLRSNGLDYEANPVIQALRRIGVASIMNRNFVQHDPLVSRKEAIDLVNASNEWIVVNDVSHIPAKPAFLLPIVDLAKYLQTAPDQERLDLTAIPAQRLELHPMALQSNVQQAYEEFHHGAEALYVVFQIKEHAHGGRIYGILTRGMVESAYRY